MNHNESQSDDVCLYTCPGRNCDNDVFESSVRDGEHYFCSDECERRFLKIHRRGILEYFKSEVQSTILCEEELASACSGPPLIKNRDNAQFGKLPPEAQDALVGVINLKLNDGCVVISNGELEYRGL